MKHRLLLVGNDPAFLVAQHIHLGVVARAAGYDVEVAAPPWAGAEQIAAMGFAFHPIRMARGGVQPVQEALACYDLVRLYRTVQPTLVHHITMKPILYGTLAARMAGVPAVVNGNTGLGYMFIDQTPATRRMRRAMVHAYRLAVRHRHRIDLFLNPDDLHDFEGLGLTRHATTMVINGPGVDVDVFRPAPEPAGVPVVVLAARMLWHKGVGEFVAAARLLRRQGVAVRLALVGAPDAGNPATVQQAQLEAWNREGIIEWWGYRRDMVSVFAAAHVAVLPSYREGLGKVLIEAAACGLPLVATDVPGCREIARPGINALRVPVRDSLGLAAAIRRLAEDPALRRRYGAAGRAIVETHFSMSLIGRQTLAVYDALSGLEADAPRPPASITPPRTTPAYAP